MGDEGGFFWIGLMGKVKPGERGPYSTTARACHSVRKIETKRIANNWNAETQTHRERRVLTRHHALVVRLILAARRHHIPEAVIVLILALVGFGRVVPALERVVRAVGRGGRTREGSR